jgi:hypothetical protein
VTARSTARRRGDPLLMLVLVIGLWVGLRTVAWVFWPDLDRSQGAVRWAADQPSIERSSGPVAEISPPARPAVGALGTAQFDSLRPPLGFAPAPDWTRPQAAPVPLPYAPLPPRPERVVMPAVPPRLAGGHALLWLAAVSQLPGPLALLDAGRRAAAPPLLPVLGGGSSPPRWSADAWALVRRGGVSDAAPFVPTYGGSQVGAVLRYRLAPGSDHRPTAYLRATAALAAAGERELAVGLSLRPLSQVPLVLAGEARAGRLGTETRVRPAVVAVTEFAPVTLPAGTRAEFYLQGGYVGGRGATPFVDGSVRIDRQVARFGHVDLRAGAGLWGGAQEGAGRLDVGPSASLDVARGRGAARVVLDWRLRLAGEAAPPSGPALTISAGF